MKATLRYQLEQAADLDRLKRRLSATDAPIAGLTELPDWCVWDLHDALDRNGIPTLEDDE